MPDQQLTWIQRNGERLADVAARHPDAPVPACPGWDVTDLVSHTGWVHRWMRYMICLPEGERPTRETSIAAGLPKLESAQHPEGNLVAWFSDGIDELVEAFATTPSTKTIRSVFGVHAPSLLIRRMVHETAIHRRDAEEAAGELTSFDPSLAADGVDELLQLWVPLRFAYDQFGVSAQTLELRPSDNEDPWTITVEPQTTTWSRSHADDPDVVARGTLNDLYLFVWNRLRVNQLDVSGNHDLLVRWQAAATV